MHERTHLDAKMMTVTHAHRETVWARRRGEIVTQRRRRIAIGRRPATFRLFAKKRSKKSSDAPKEEAALEPPLPIAEELETPAVVTDAPETNQEEEVATPEKLTEGEVEDSEIVAEGEVENSEMVAEEGAQVEEEEHLYEVTVPVGSEVRETRSAVEWSVVGMGAGVVAAIAGAVLVGRSFAMRDGASRIKFIEKIQQVTQITQRRAQLEMTLMQDLEHQRLQKEAEDRLNELMTIIQLQQVADLSAKVRVMSNDEGPQEMHVESER